MTEPKNPKGGSGLDVEDITKLAPGALRQAADSGEASLGDGRVVRIKPYQSKRQANGHHDDAEPPPWGSPGHAPNLASRNLKTAELDGVVMTHVEWLWNQRIARSKLTIITGDPSQGKTCVMLDICARITRGGKWPGADDESQEVQGRVIIVSAEDAANDTLKPRLLAAGGDPSKVTVVQAVTELDEQGKRIPAAFSFQRDLDHLVTDDVLMVAFDPLNAFLGEGISSHESASVRGVLGILDEFAQSRNVAVLGIMHPPKAVSGGKAMNAISGSAAFAAAARVALLCSTDQEDDDEERHLFTAAKNNLGRRPNALAYRIAEKLVSADGITVSSPWVQWEARSFFMSADEAMAQTPRDKDKPKTDVAEKFLREELADGARTQAEVMAAAGKAGIAEKTLRRVKTRLGIKSRKDGAAWMWEFVD